MIWKRGESLLVCSHIFSSLHFFFFHLLILIKSDECFIKLSSFLPRASRFIQYLPVFQNTLFITQKKKKRKKKKKKRKYTLYIIVRVHFSNKPDTKQSPKKKKKGCHILQNYNLNHPKPTILTSLS